MPDPAAPGGDADLFARPDLDCLYRFDDDADIDRTEVAAHFDGNGRFKAPVPVVVRQFEGTRWLGRGQADLELGDDGVMARFRWPRAVEDIMETTPFARLDVEWADDGTPERVVVVLNDPTADPTLYDDDATQSDGSLGGETDPEPEPASGTAATERPSRTMKVKIETNDTYEDLLHKLDGDHEAVGRRLFKNVRSLAARKPADDEAVIPKTDADLIAAYKALGSPDDLKSLKADAEAYRNAAPELTKFREFGKPDDIKTAIESGQKAAADLAKNERDKDLAAVAGTMKWKAEPFAVLANKDGWQFVATKRKQGGKEVDSFDAKKVDADGAEVVRPIEELVKGDWAVWAPALQLEAAPARREMQSTGGYRPGETHYAPNHNRDAQSAPTRADEIRSFVLDNIVV